MRNAIRVWVIFTLSEEFMEKSLFCQAGPRALAHIRERGLAPEDVRLILGASGAAKWLGIKGLDAAIFGEFLANIDTPITLWGTSIGAWKLAAACRKDPVAAFDLLADNYIHQYYKKGDGRREVDLEAQRIVDAFLPDEAIEEILASERFRLNFSVVRCKGGLASDEMFLMLSGLGKAFLTNLKDRSRFIACFDRMLFCDARDDGTFNIEMKGAVPVVLTRENFREALLATGSIPIVMSAVTDIPGAGPGTYRDGGLVDYHPIPPEPLNGGIVLYPHFYPEVTPGWFDKKFPKRRATPEELSDVLLLSPSPEFVASLPHGRIPDRKDFKRFAGDDAGREKFWKTAAAETRRLGDAFLEAVSRGRLADIVVPMKTY